MKNTIKKMIKAIAGVCAIAAVFAMSDNTGGTALAMSVVAGVAGGKHVINEPLTVALTNVESPDLLVNEIDRRLVKIRPMATPIDQLSRWAGAKKSGSMVVDYYSVDTRPTSTKVTRSVEGCSDNVGASRFQKVQLPVENADLFEASAAISPTERQRATKTWCFTCCGRAKTGHRSARSPSTDRPSASLKTAYRRYPKAQCLCAWGAPRRSSTCRPCSLRPCPRSRRTIVKSSRCR